MKILRSMDATWIKIETSWANNWLLNLWVILPVVALGLLMMMALLWLMYRVGKLEGPSRMPDNSTRGRSVHANSRVIKSSARFVRPRELEGVRMMGNFGHISDLFYTLLNIILHKGL